MEKETMGRVVSCKKQWWLKVNTKAVRKGPLDGAVFPHIIQVEYTAGDKTYTKRKWISAGAPAPAVGSLLTVRYEEEDPRKARID